MTQQKDLCKTCEHYWQDFPMPLEQVISHCEILDKKPGNKSMDEIVPFPCTKCPFDSYLEKKQCL
jgi:hypothetical protein